LEDHFYLELAIDGVLLLKSFVEPTGLHPPLVSPIGWSKEKTRESVSQLLLEDTSPLASGRIPILVCARCGDLLCGCIAARITQKRDFVLWDDWAYEDNDVQEEDLGDWKKTPSDLVFEYTEYERTLRSCCGV
jgi:hypothetical protein